MERLSGFALAAIGSLFGCQHIDASATSSGGGYVDDRPEYTSRVVDQLDLLLVIDDSPSMADKEQLVADAIPVLLEPLLAEPSKIASAHIGVITSSLGGHGSDACAAAKGAHPNDAGHLVARAPLGEKAHGGAFLRWDPGADRVAGDAAAISTLSKDAASRVEGAGEAGCEYPSQLESFYRFLVDPAPYASIAFEPRGTVVRFGVDDVLLQERADFLRPGSLLAVLLVSDKDDCSTREYSFYPISNQLVVDGAPYHLPPPRAECADAPGSACCLSCGESPASCPPDPTCTPNSTLADADDPPALRCWDQKRRFGIDFLYPVERYRLALAAVRIPDPHANGGADGTDLGGPLVDNPIFTDLNKSGDPIRDPSLVFFAAVVGVPWQDVARDPEHAAEGPDAAAELAEPRDAAGHTTWDFVLGDPERFVAPLDPHMIPSNAPRTGVDPATGTPLAPTDAARHADPINGRERVTGGADLEYACTFALATPRDCSGGAPGCDCGDPATNAANPICDPEVPTRQIAAKAYPALRELELVRALGAQGVVGSGCAANRAAAGASSFGYRPAARALADALVRSVGRKNP